MAKRIKIREIINSKAADDDMKGNIVFEEIKKGVIDTSEEIILDFDEIELVNTAFLNNAVGQLFNREEYDISKNGVRIVNMQKTMIELLKESISVAKAKFN